MTKKEFDSAQWGAGMKCRYDGVGMIDIVSVDFDERLLGLDIYDDIENLKWVRCENVTNVTKFVPAYRL